MTVFSHITNPHGFPVNEKSRRRTIADVRDGKVGVVSVAHALLIAHSSLAPVPPPPSPPSRPSPKSSDGVQGLGVRVLHVEREEVPLGRVAANFAVAMIWVLCAIVLSKHLDGLHKKLPESDDAVANSWAASSPPPPGGSCSSRSSAYSASSSCSGGASLRPSHPPPRTDPPAEVTFKPTPTTSLSRAVLFFRVFSVAQLTHVPPSPLSFPRERQTAPVPLVAPRSLLLLRLPRVPPQTIALTGAGFSYGLIVGSASTSSSPWWR